MTRIRLAENVVHRSFGAETVLLNLDSGQYHGLRGAGGRMLEALAATGELDSAAHRVATEFGHPVDEVRRDLEELCAGLEARALVVREEADERP